MLRRKKPPADPLAHVDPNAIGPRWAAHVREALAARARWQQVLDGVRSGPVRDRLAELAARVDEGVVAVWETATRADAAERIAATLDVDRITAEHKRAMRDPTADPAMVEALAARFRSAQRVLNAVDDADERLRLLDARLGAAVARAAEVALTAGEGATSLDAELDAVIGELGALRDSLLSLA